MPNSKARHEQLRGQFKVAISGTEKLLKIEKTALVTYDLLSMVSMWIKIPREKATVPAIQNFACKFCKSKYE